MQWDIEIGRIDIQTEVALILKYQPSPREGHLGVLYLIFQFLLNSLKKRLVIDPHEPDIYERAFNSYAGWKEFYGEVVE